MAIFRTKNLEKLLCDKFVVLIGDSVQRSVYKDLVVLYHENRFMSQGELRKKGEESFLDDKLIERSELTNGTNYKEVREFKTEHLHIRFYFITRVYNEYVESIIKEIENPDTPKPDVIMLNSCLWDISRYGRNSMDKYRENLKKLCCRLEDSLPANTLVLWRTTLPVSEEMKGGFLTSDAEWCRDMLKLDVLRANYFAFNIVSMHKFDVLDMHYHFRFQLHRRARDGVHWNMYAHRRMTNILLSHIAEAWSFELPEYPWADNLRIEFTPDEIEMNSTNVLMRAYDPNLSTARPIPGLLPTPRNIRRKSLSEERYGGPIRSTQEMYSGYYDVPQEEPEVDQQFEYYDEYNFLPQEPIVNRCIALPTNPYPDFAEDNLLSNTERNVGPVRNPNRRFRQRQNVLQRPTQLSNRRQVRIDTQRKKERNNFFSQHQSFLSSQQKWSKFSRHNPNFNNFGH